MRLWEKNLSYPNEGATLVNKDILDILAPAKLPAECNMTDPSAH